MIKKLKQDLQKYSSKENAKNLQRFFKTGKGEYGEGDVFIGVRVPNTRKIVKENWESTSLDICKKLLKSKIHEERLLGLLVLVKKYEKAEDKLKKEIFDIYVNNTQHINSWDLVDLSAPNIFGNWLFNFAKDGEHRVLMEKMAESRHLWTRRIAILGTFYFIRQGQFNYTLKLAKILLNDSHDLIHKAVGWMLREVGKKDKKVLEDFLKKHYKEMPRTMLRYAIEKLNPKERLKYLKGEI